MTDYLHPKWRGLFVFSGLQGLGKSTLGFSADLPEKTGVIDFDLKGEDMAKEYGIPKTQFWQPSAFMKPDMDPTEYDREKISEWAVERFVDLPPLRTLVVDNATALEAGFAYIVEKNPAKYGLNVENVKAGRYGGANPGVSLLWQNLAAYLKNQKGVELIIMINHMTQPWANGQPVPNRFHVKGNKIFRNLSAGTFILVPGDPKRGGEPPVPSALVIKEALAVRVPGKDNQRPTTRRALPFRFPIADWAPMSEYFETPANFRNPKPGETWNEFEINAYGEFLSEETLRWIREAAKIKYSEDGAEGGEGGTVDPIREGKLKLFEELKKAQPEKFKTMDDVAREMRNKQLIYSLAEHEKVRKTLLGEPQAA